MYIALGCLTISKTLILQFSTAKNPNNLYSVFEQLRVRLSLARITVTGTVKEG